MKQKWCPICKSKKIKLRINTGELKLFVCQSCAVHFAETQSNKTSDYYKKYSFKTYSSYYKTFRIKFFKQNWKIIQSIKPKGKGIDIGASFGWFIKSAPKSWKMHGLEPSKKASEYARSQRLSVITGTDEKLTNKVAIYDLVTLWNVFEHLPKPIQSLTLIKNTLKPKGLLVIAIPNRQGLINRLLTSLSYIKIYGPLNTLFQTDTSSPHLFHYSLADIRKLLDQTGFELLQVRNQPIIDVSNIEKRMSLEMKKYQLLTPLIKMTLTTLSQLSFILHMPDEIVIYAQKK